MNIPNLPDSFYKILSVLGLFVVGYCFFDFQKSESLFNSQTRDLNVAIDSAIVRKAIIINRKERLLREVKRLAKQNNIPDPIIDHDSICIISPSYSVPNSRRLDSAVNLLYEDLIDVNLEKKIQIVIIHTLKAKIEDLTDTNDTGNKALIGFGMMGLSLLLLGLLDIHWQQKMNDRLLIDQINKTNRYEHCESCGKSFSSMRENGKKMNGELNEAFCSECYEDGRFVEPELTFEEFLNRATPELQRYSKRDRKDLLKRLRSLERWNKDEY